MRGYLLAAAVAISVALAMTSGLASAQSTSRAVVHKPSVTLVFATELTAKGKYFKKGETVTLTIASATVEKKWTKKVKATSKGTFSASFGVTSLNSCDQYTLKAVGSLKSRYSESHDLVPC